MKDVSVILTYIIEYPGTNLIKVGQAKYFVDRLAQLKTGSPVDPHVVCVFRGAEHEREFHKRFVHLRHHGEFYHYTKELRDYIYSKTLDEFRMTRAEAEAISPRIERAADRVRREKRLAKSDVEKANEMQISLETDEQVT